MARFEPKASPLTEPFWDATRDKKLLVQWCPDCDAGVYWPRVHCPRCLGGDLGWKEASGRGSVYSFSVMHVAGNPMMADRVPYVIGLVDLDEGVRIATNIVGCEPAAVRVAMAVAVTWETMSDGRNLPLFEPA
jgi:uncharacterized OB-fold protein